jgi:diguanylate cyclase (GGDEF)-like protein
MKKSYLLALTGLLLGCGAPIGAFLLRVIPSPLSFGGFCRQELRENDFFYLYMLFGTCCAFSLFGFLIGRSEDILIRKDAALSQDVMTDPLTGLGNHRFLHEIFGIEFRKHQDNHQPISCLMMDLDFFKRVNDAHGHPFGDLVLKLFAKIIQESVRQGDIATRYGGEEFLCILPNCDEKEARAVAERIRGEMAAETFRSGPYDVKVTVSVGVVTVHHPMETNYHAMIEAADKNLYEAKQRGRNQVVPTILAHPKNLAH